MEYTKNSLPPLSPEDFYSISEIVWSAHTWKDAFDEIAQKARRVFIFDNLAIYLKDRNGQHLEASYAKSAGRGKNAEADAAWGEEMANRVVAEQRTILEEPHQPLDPNRLKQPHMLGIPLLLERKAMGAAIFIRFGGPVFTMEDHRFAKYLVQEISMMVSKQNLESCIETREAQNQVLQIQEDFISTLSHEMNTPLGFIKGYTTTLLRPNTHWDHEKQQEFLAVIDQETDRLRIIIENLLDSARLQTGKAEMKFEVVRMDILINDVILHIKQHYPDINISLQSSPYLRPILGDALRLAQVFENLVINAIKYAPGSPIVILIREKANGIWIDVQDIGPGIPEKYLPFIFERFYRVPETALTIHGSGLGLFICKKIIQAHHGQITVESNSGQGTIFHIFLPERP